MRVVDEYLEQTYRQDKGSTLQGSPRLERLNPLYPASEPEKNAPLELHKVVIANKMTRYQHEVALHGRTG
jgi:hypothetical protein